MAKDKSCGPDLTIKPILKELLRTKVCFPDISLLVDRIEIASLADVATFAGKEAYCLFLTDGEKTIQAVLKRRIHKIINNFDIREGSVVVLKEYRLNRAQKLNRGGEILYLAISDLYSIGHDKRPSRPEEYIEPSSEHQSDHDTTSIPHDVSDSVTAGTLQPVRKPLKLIPLAGFTGVNASRNRTIDVLALIVACDTSTQKPSRMPLKKDIRIADASTEREVVLSIFVDPEHFHASRGTVALFRQVTTHDWKGGRLAAYPVHCAGKKWFCSEPSGIEGISARDVDRLRTLWVQKTLNNAG